MVQRAHLGGIEVAKKHHPAPIGHLTEALADLMYYTHGFHVTSFSFQVETGFDARSAYYVQL